MIHKPLVLNDGKISQLPTGDTISGAGTVDSVKFNYHLAALASYDRIAAVNYADAGLRTQRVSDITYTSALFPDSDIVATVAYLDVGTMNQRIDKIDFVGLVFSPDSLRKVFTYTLSGIKYRTTNFHYELF